jgi:hypothetical protein
MILKFNINIMMNIPLHLIYLEVEDTLTYQFTKSMIHTIKTITIITI